MAQTSGGMASLGRMSGAGAVATPGNLAGGLNAEGTIAGTGEVSNAAMGLIMSAVAHGCWSAPAQPCATGAPAGA